MSLLSRLKQLAIKHKFWIVCIGIVLALSIFFVIKNWLDTPTDLGPQLVYIGKDYSSGCVLFYCDSPASTTYYFGTGMTRTDITKQLEAAGYNGDTNGSNNFSLFFENKEAGAHLGFTFYEGNDRQALITDYHLRSINRPYIIEVTSHDYKELQKVFH